MFQSTPAITGGRSAACCAPAPPRPSFNPRPPSLAGDPSYFVFMLFPLLFQSTPAITGGRSADAEATIARQMVSIHARHHWRAIPATAAIQKGQPCFNPRPPSLAGDPCNCFKLSAPTEFQSTPAITGGRSSIVCAAVGVCMVSIHARHHWRAILAWVNQWSVMVKFQSTPAITGGRSEATRRIAESVNRFNPRPPSLAGDPAWGLVHHCLCACFNPRPPSLAGDPLCN